MESPVVILRDGKLSKKQHFSQERKVKKKRLPRVKVKSKSNKWVHKKEVRENLFIQ